MEFHATFPSVPATVAQVRTTIDRTSGPRCPPGWPTTSA